MQEKIQKLIQKHSQKLRFILVGGANTAIDFLILFGLSSSGVSTITANFASTTTAFIFSFFANKKFTFKSKTDSSILKEMILFTAVTLFGLWVIQGIIIHFLTPAVQPFTKNQQLALLIAKLIATIFSLVWNYVLYSRLVFYKK